MFYVFSFPPGVYVGTFDLIASISGPSILTLRRIELKSMHIRRYVINT